MKPTEGSITNGDRSRQTGIEAISPKASGLTGTLPQTQSSVERGLKLSRLGSGNSNQLLETGDSETLSHAIKFQEDALNLCPENSSDRRRRFGSLADSLLQRYHCSGEVGDLSRAIGLWEEAVEIPIVEGSQQRVDLENLASALLDRYEGLGKVDDLDKAINLEQDALVLCPRGHPERRTRLASLASAIRKRVHLKGDVADLTKRVELLQEALDLYPEEHPERRIGLQDLALSFGDRSLRTGNLADQSSAVALRQEALDLCPVGHPDRSRELANLGVSLGRRYHLTGDQEDLSRAIELEEEALELCPRGHPARRARLRSLASSLRNRAHRQGDMKDMSRRIELLQEALELCPKRHPDRLRELENLALALGDRSLETDDATDQSKSIALRQEALDLYPKGHPERATSLVNLGVSLARRYHLTGNVTDLSEAIELEQEALDLCPKGHPSRTLRLLNLATTIGERFRCLGETADLVATIDLRREALEELRSNDYPDRSRLLGMFARSLANWLRRTGITSRTPTPDSAPKQDDTDVQLESSFRTFTGIFTLLQEDTQHSLSPVAVRLREAKAWRDLARELQHDSELDAAIQTLDLLELAVAQSRSLESLYARLSEDEYIGEAKDEAADAAALAIERGDLQLAVTLVEQGRGLIFSRLGRYRTSLVDVQALAPGLALRFLELSDALGKFMTRGDNIGPVGDLEMPKAQDRGISYQKISTEWNNIVEDIRKIKGLELFLSRPSFSQLQESASDGPVITVNISSIRSDAIVVLPRREPALVSLPHATPEKVQSLADRLGPRPSELHDNDLILILRELWDYIVRPVAVELGKYGSREGFRIWWTCVGAASRLPVHAAGPYKPGQKNLDHMFISSYTPTLNSLIRARQARAAGSSSQGLLLVSQSDTPNEIPLPGVKEEVRSILKYAPHAKVLDGEAGTRSAVLVGVGDYPWLHLACHGHHNAAQPFLSYFALHDGKLSLVDIIEKKLLHAELAVLSACHSARVAESMPDEALHAAAGMLFAGYKSVIGTMWALDDSIGSSLAGEFYRLMMGGKNEPKDCSKAAIGLCKAFEALEKRGGAIPLAQRINVIHFGI